MRRTGLAAWSPLLLWSLISGHVTCGVHWLGTGVMYAQVSTRPPPTCHSLTWSWHYPSAQSNLLQTIRASVVTLDFCTMSWSRRLYKSLLFPSQFLDNLMNFQNFAWSLFREEQVYLFLWQSDNFRPYKYTIKCSVGGPTSLGLSPAFANCKCLYSLLSIVQNSLLLLTYEMSRLVAAYDFKT